MSPDPSRGGGGGGGGGGDILYKMVIKVLMYLNGP